jgi:hypothetical protein
MSSTIFDKDTLLDLTVNIVPLAILAFFLVAFVVMNPWGAGFGFERVLQFAIVGLTFVALAILTYVAAVRIEGEEAEEADAVEE